MREIKFRVWNQHNANNPLGSMHYDVGILNGLVLSKKSEPFAHPTLMQYTGLKDAKGVEIYEGDIVNVSPVGTFGQFAQYKGNVEFHNGAFCVVRSTTETASLHDIATIGKRDVHLSIIGNIYENSDMLE